MGEQDWFNLLHFESPSLVFVLPCEYNLQMDNAYELQDPFKVISANYDMNQLSMNRIGIILLLKITLKLFVFHFILLPVF